MIRYLVQDIETVPESEIASMWNPEDEAKDDRYPNREPFPPVWAHKVATIGMLALDGTYMPRKGGCAAGGLTGGKSEREMIERWSEVASGKVWRQGQALKMVDYNGRGFDVPVLQTRAFRYGVPLPWYFGLLPDNRGEISKYSKSYRDRYQGWHVDVQEVWTNNRAFRFPKLEHLARLMGLPGKNGFDGAKVYEAYKEGQLAEIDNYCMHDVVQTAFVFVRMEYMAGRMSLGHYRDVCIALLAFVAELPDSAVFLEGVERPVLLLEDRVEEPALGSEYQATPPAPDTDDQPAPPAEEPVEQPAPVAESE